MFYFLNKNKNHPSAHDDNGYSPQPYEDMFNPDQSHHFNQYGDEHNEHAPENVDPNRESISTPTADRNSKLDDSNGKRPDSRTNGTGSGLSRKSELPPVTTESDATRIDYMKSITSSRPPSGKKPRPITAKLRTKNQSDEPIVNENSSTQARPRSGKTRPNSGVKRRSIPSTKDSLLMLHAGSASDDDDGTYGKANDDELENYLAAKTDRSLTIENEDESDEELRILMTKIGDDDPLSSNTNIKEIPSSSRNSTRTKENLVSSRLTESHRTSAISDDVTIMASTSIDIVSDVSKDSINRKTTINSWPDDTPTPSIHQGPSALSDKTNRTSNSGAIKQNESTECHNSHTQSVMEIRRKHTPVEVERKTKSVGDMSEKNESLLQSNPYEAIPVDGKSSTPKRNHKKKSDKGTWGFKNSATPSEVTASQTSVVSSNTRNSRNSEDVNDAESAIINKEEEGSDEELNLDLDNESAYSKSTTGTVDSEELANKENKKPKWHPPWQLKQEVIAHTDAIPVLMIDPSNRWFATGSADRTVKLWDINTCRPKLVIKAHKQSIRAMTFGATGHRQLFTTGDDRQLLCHDVEVNRVTAKFKGQSAVIYGITTYQPSHLLITAARDKLLKIYDTRTTKCVKTLRGHQNTVSCVQAIEETRQIVSGSHDSTLRLWDIGEGRCVNVLQGHVKSVRGLAQHPDGSTILSASSERILAWKLPTGEIVQEIQAENIAINSITINRLGVTVAGGSNGVMHLWDFNSAHRFQKIHRTRVYESQELPICVFAAKFDHTGSKLICSDACNVVKIYREAFTKSRPILDVRYVKPSEEIPLGKNYIVPDSPKKE